MRVELRFMPGDGREPVNLIHQRGSLSDLNVQELGLVPHYVITVAIAWSRYRIV